MGAGREWPAPIFCLAGELWCRADFGQVIFAANFRKTIGQFAAALFGGGVVTDFGVFCDDFGIQRAGLTFLSLIGIGQGFKPQTGKGEVRGGGLLGDISLAKGGCVIAFGKCGQPGKGIIADLGLNPVAFFFLRGFEAFTGCGIC